MELLIAAPRFPYPTRTGDTLTVFHLLQHFARRHELDLVACTEQPPSEEQLAAVTPFCRNVFAVPLRRSRKIVNLASSVFRNEPIQARWFYSPVGARVIKNLVQRRHYDVLYAHTIRMARYLAIPRSSASQLRVLAMQISMELNYRRLARFERNPLYRLVFNHEAALLATYEARVAESFDHALVISDVDRRAISDNGDGRFLECPHGVILDDQPADPATREPFSLVFSGNMQYRPNVDAATYFVREILPRVRQHVPATKFYVVGARPTASVQRLAYSGGVVVTGEVESIYDWLRRAAVGVNPLRAGAGLQNKVLEGMACGLPMVVTSVANEGIKAISGRHLLVADSAEAFSTNVVRLLTDSWYRRRLGEAAREFIKQYWSWTVHFDRLERFLEHRSG